MRILSRNLTRNLCLAYSLLSLHSVQAGEVWFYRLHSGHTIPCTLRAEKTIDELWNKLELDTSAIWEVPKDMRMIPGVVLESKSLGREYSFYRSREACEYERAQMEVVLSRDPRRIEDYKQKQTADKILSALTPNSVVNKQNWLDAFAGCTDSRLKAGMVIKGQVEATLSFCECIATMMAKINPNSSETELQSRIPAFLKQCLPE